MEKKFHWGASKYNVANVNIIVGVQAADRFVYSYFFSFNFSRYCLAQNIVDSCNNFVKIFSLPCDLHYQFSLENAKEHSRTIFRNAECSKTFSNGSNIDHHEKKSGHSTTPRRNGLQIPIFSKELKKHLCLFPNCPVTLKYKSKITLHMKAGCQTLSKKKVDNKVYLYCKEIFAQKLNCNRHIKRIHANAEANLHK